jgi:hypothetical protein
MAGGMVRKRKKRACEKSDSEQLLQQSCNAAIAIEGVPE